MAVHYTIWVPAVALAHAIALVLFLYSAERVSGVLSRSWRGLARPLRGRHKASPQADVERAGSASTDIQLTERSPTGQPGLLACGCQVSATCLLEQDGISSLLQDASAIRIRSACTGNLHMREQRACTQCGRPSGACLVKPDVRRHESEDTQTNACAAPCPGLCQAWRDDGTCGAIWRRSAASLLCLSCCCSVSHFFHSWLHLQANRHSWTFWPCARQPAPYMDMYESCCNAP